MPPRPRIVIFAEDTASGERARRHLAELGFDVTIRTASVGQAIDGERFFEASLDLLCVLDHSGYFKRLNPAWEDTLGFTLDELMSRPFIDFVHPDDRERTLAQNARVRAGGQALAFENRYRHRDGSYRWLHWNAAPDTGARAIYSVARDVTDARRAAEEREVLVRHLRGALAEVKTLRSILPICSYCRKIRDDEDAWHSVEVYVAEHTDAKFSHGICPDCLERVVDDDLDGGEFS
jgi:PAS domain S-box-containing protein